MAVANTIRSTANATPQLVRFAVAGLGVTALSALLYLGLAAAGLPPLVANLFSHGGGVLVGFHVHSRWTFRDEARSDGAARIVRFAAGSTAALLLNSLWVWALVTAGGAPSWAPLPAMLFVTPLASFALNRWWVFARG
jgi:putative flippase GtrA